MTSYRLGPVVGRIGGTKADRLEVDMPGLLGSGVDHVLIQLGSPPEGLSRLAHIEGEFLASPSVGYLRPQLVVGNSVSDTWPIGPAKFTGLLNEPAQVAIRTNTAASNSATHFRGIVYVADIELED